MWLRVSPVVFFGCAALIWPALCAAVTTSAYEGFLIRIWQTEDGLPQNTVTSITQSSDGYLWVGTYAGVARFDGVRFHTFDVVTNPALGDERISSLFEDSKGVLWIGNQAGRAVHYSQGRFEEVLNTETSPFSVREIAEDSAGKIWYFRSDGSFTPNQAIDTKNGTGSRAGARVLSFARGREGTCWISVHGVAAELMHGVLHELDFGPATWTSYVRALGAAQDGGLWVVRDGRIRKWLDGKWTEDRGEWGKADITHMIELRNGALAIGTMTEGVELRYPDGHALKFDFAHCGIQNWTRSLCEDREGNLWVAGGSGGLAMLRKTAFGALNPPDRWQGHTVLSVTSGTYGELWIGTEGAGVYRYEAEKWIHYDQAQGLTDTYVWAAAVDPSGGVWLGTWGAGVFLQNGERFEHPEGLGPVTRPVLALRFVADSLWVGTGNGLLQKKGSAVIWRGRNPSPPELVVADIASDKTGTLWLAMQDNGLGKVTEDGIEKFTPDQGLSHDSVQCLLADNESLWIGTHNGGLSRLKAGRVSRLGQALNLASRVICHIEEDAYGFLWLSTHRGIVRVSKRELNRCADGATSVVQSETFDENDGLPTLEYSGGMQAGGCRGRDGRLWFASNRGLASVNPAELPLNPLPPPVMVESIRVDGHLYEVSGDRPFPHVAPEHERIEFEYTALSLAASRKVLFRYRLQGIERDWIEAGDRRNAFYSHLPSGHYLFQVIACNNDGVWNTVGQSVALIVEPYYWQTWWFRSFAVLVAATLVALLVGNETRRRMHRRFKELEFERGIERERTRIAQDLHDDIGSTLSRISMLSQPSRPESLAPERASAVLRGIHDATLEVAQTLDEIVWAVNPRHDTLDSLACYIARSAQETLAEARIACHTDLPLDLPAWRIHASVRHNVLLAFKEVLNNVVKHSKATEVQISLVLRPIGFVLSVEDNGISQKDAAIETATFSRVLGGNGLENIRRRLSKIGGVCEIDSSTGKGWRVVFIVDLDQAV